MKARRSAVLMVLTLLAACAAPAPASVQPTEPPLPTATATATAAGTSTPSAVASPSGASEGFVPEADADRLLADLVALQEAADANGGIRATGTPGYDASVAHVASVLEGIGFEVDEPEVEYTAFSELPGSRLEVGGTVVEGTDELRALLYSGSGDVSGPVVALEESGCAPGDFATFPRGAIALTTLGGCFRRDQAINAEAAGAVALIVGYPDRGPGEIFRPTLIEPAAVDIPVASVTGATVDLLNEAGDARLIVRTERTPGTFRNVIAQLGAGPSVVMLGAHLDSVLDGPGLNDNGSGVVAILEIARRLAEEGVPEGWAVRIGLWGAEEFGAIGSRAYAGTVGDEVVAYLNLDMTGSVNGANLVYAEAGAAPGSEAITAAYEAWFEGHGIEIGLTDAGGGSDHAGFIRAGIPTGGLFAGATESGGAANPSTGRGEAMDPCYHIACDTVENVDLDRVAIFTDATHAVLVDLMQR